MRTDGSTDYSAQRGEIGRHRIMINLRRWLQGSPGYPVTIEEYHAGVINHEFGHFLGFAHMKCGALGEPGPVMMTGLATVFRFFA